MDIVSQFQTLSPYLSLEEVDQVLVARCTDDFPLLELHLESRNACQALFEAVSASRQIGAMVLLGTPVCFSGELMDRFWRHVLDHERSGADLAAPHAATGTVDFRRGEMGIHQLANNIRDCNKVIVIALQGEVVSPFLGAALVCDYRVVADTTVFRNRAYQFGMPPGGALTYLLPAYIGFGKASEILLEGRDIRADEAQRLGLVSRRVPPEELEGAALEAARRFAAMPRHAVAAVKKLLTHRLHALADHFELETALINRCMYRLSHDKLNP